MKCTSFINNLEIQAANVGMTDTLRPYFATMHEALPLLEQLLLRMRDDQTVSSEFKKASISILQCGDFSEKNLRELSIEYSRTHNDPKAADWMPIVLNTQAAGRVLSSIVIILDELKNELPSWNQHLKSAIKQQTLIEAT